MAVTYPPGVMEQLKSRGKTFRPEPTAHRHNAVPVKIPEASPEAPTAAGRAMATRAEEEPTGIHDQRILSPSQFFPTSAPTNVDRTTVDATQIGPPTASPPPAPDEEHFDRTVPSLRSPYGQLPAGTPEPEAMSPAAPPPPTEPHYEPTEIDRQEARPMAPPPPSASAAPPAKTPKSPAGPKKKGGCMGRMLKFGAVLAILGVISAGVGYLGVSSYYGKDLPTIEALRAYSPPTVTVVYDKNGEVLGELFEQRRYVIELEEMPEHLKQAFLAAEDANFYNHDGVDYMGIVRAILRNAAQGRMAQGASTITQQVTRNFLLTRDKKLERKIKEVLLSWRIEKAYEKEHILFLYLNEIYLGSGAYGVEAASRVYFEKSAKDLTLAEAAILAGLPQRPSDYSPHRHWDKAQGRQEYVLTQMVRNEFITEAEKAAALAEDVVVAPKTDDFGTKAPHFTEYVRRYLVDTYGHDRVYNEGLQVTTTCDLELQDIAQQAVIDGVYSVDQRMGFRREGVENVGTDGIAAKQAEIDLAIREARALELDPAGRTPAAEETELVAGKRYDAIVLDVKKRYAKVGIGKVEAIIPLAWTEWLYKPNPRKSWRYRTATDMTEGSVLQTGDVVWVQLEALSTKDEAVAKAFKKTPGESTAFAAARLWQEPEVEGALLSYDVDSGAVRSMVGGAFWEKSEFNRAVQSKRQVGSTFKPIVYAAAIESERVTTATMIVDGPLAFATDQDFIWKPANYGNDFLGNITLRKALAMSRNTCTVRVLEAIDPGMNDDVVYEFARRLGIGGTPAHMLPEDHVSSKDNDHLCPWVRETPDSTICMDRNPPKDPEISNTRHRKLMGPDDVYMCRSCDLSMGLGSASLTMEELARAYSAFASGGELIEPYYIEEVRDVKGEVLEKHEKPQSERVMSPEVASITTWLLQGVATEGTAARASRLGIPVAGKTGTTNDEKDAWFVGFTPEIITAVWVGYDTPRSLGVSSTGGRTSLPIWMDYMEDAARKDTPSFVMRGDVEWAQIDQDTGRRVSSGGRRYPFLPETLPDATGASAGQVTAEDLITEL
ncbi:MAG: transglycosylase domain-containing protein [Proteobacteria bacterium]|nr:transglycosylase domain-containing protein [Pseudomonadota bacterium]